MVKVIKSSGNEGLVIFGDGGVGDFSLEDLLKASAEVLGKGTCGTTYKAYLDGGSETIVKRLRNVCVSEREFRERIEGMGVVVHENLVPLIAYFYNKDEQLLVYDSMPMGSLFSLLHGKPSLFFVYFPCSVLFSTNDSSFLCIAFWLQNSATVSYFQFCLLLLLSV